MTSDAIFNSLKTEFGDDVISLTESKEVESFIIIKAHRITEICLYLRDEPLMLFDYLVNLSGMDYKENFTVVYHLYSISNKHRIVLKVELEKDNPVVPTVELVWKSANWHEREAYDMFGIQFEGHPYMVRILCPYDWVGHPLRKDYKEPETYHGIKVAY